MKGKDKYRQQRRQNARANEREALRIDVTVFGETYSLDDGILDRPIDDEFDLPEIMGDVARHYIDRAMEECGGNKTKAAKRLGLNSYQTLTNWIEKYDS